VETQDMTGALMQTGENGEGFVL